MQKGLENHVKSCPKCPHDLTIARAASFGLSPPACSSQLIDHHLFHFETDANLATKLPVDVMWHDENAFKAAPSMPDSPSKSCAGAPRLPAWINPSAPRAGGGGAAMLVVRVL
jgi:hypothetical protein